MRINRPATVQTSCDNEDCTAYAITAGLSATRETRDTVHRRMLTADGWTDREGRDYCPDHPAARTDRIDHALAVHDLETDLLGGCGICDTEHWELCAGCQQCRCHRHDTCQRPA